MKHFAGRTGKWRMPTEIYQEDVNAFRDGINPGDIFEMNVAETVESENGRLIIPKRKRYQIVDKFRFIASVVESGKPYTYKTIPYVDLMLNATKQRRVRC